MLLREKPKRKLLVENMELDLDSCFVFIPKTISDFLAELSDIRDDFEKLSKLDDYVKKLEDEMRKIDAFKRELPLSMLLLSDGGSSSSMDILILVFYFINGF